MKNVGHLMLFLIVLSGFLFFLRKKIYQTIEKMEELNLKIFRYLKTNREGPLAPLSRLWWPRVGIRTAEVYPK